MNQKFKTEDSTEVKVSNADPMMSFPNDPRLVPVCEKSKPAFSLSHILNSISYSVNSCFSLV